MSILFFHETATNLVLVIFSTLDAEFQSDHIVIDLTRWFPKNVVRAKKGLFELKFEGARLGLFMRPSPRLGRALYRGK